MNEQKDQELIDLFQEIVSHSDNRFDNRLNFFLIFESVLLGVVGVLYSKPIAKNPVLLLIILLGLLLITILWGYIQHREKYLFDTAHARFKELSAEYTSFVLNREKGIWPIHPTWLLTYGVPILIALIWIALLISVFTS
jgi:hypothetical protein